MVEFSHLRKDCLSQAHPLNGPVRKGITDAVNQIISEKGNKTYVEADTHQYVGDDMAHTILTLRINGSEKEIIISYDPHHGKVTGRPNEVLCIYAGDHLEEGCTNGALIFLTSLSSEMQQHLVHMGIYKAHKSTEPQEPPERPKAWVTNIPTSNPKR